MFASYGRIIAVPGNFDMNSACNHGNMENKQKTIDLEIAASSEGCCSRKTDKARETSGPSKRPRMDLSEPEEDKIINLEETSTDDDDDDDEEDVPVSGGSPDLALLIETAAHSAAAAAGAAAIVASAASKASCFANVTASIASAAAAAAEAAAEAASVVADRVAANDRLRGSARKASPRHGRGCCSGPPPPPHAG